MKDSELNPVIDQVIDTLKFHGVEITNVSITGWSPSFKIIVYSKSLKKDLQTTLNFAYWVLWTLVYGKYSDDKSNLKIALDYSTVDEVIL